MRQTYRCTWEVSISEISKYQCLILILDTGMEYAVRHQHEQYGSELKPGDHILTNHPLTGGTHLPDITILTPVWDNEGKNIIFYVASRGHHGK